MIVEKATASIIRVAVEGTVAIVVAGYQSSDYLRVRQAHS